jgi:hypothetical protein
VQAVWGVSLSITISPRIMLLTQRILYWEPCTHLDAANVQDVACDDCRGETRVTTVVHIPAKAKTATSMSTVIMLGCVPWATICMHQQY